LITWRQVESSNIKAVGWDTLQLQHEVYRHPTFAVGFVEFKSGAIYAYLGVPRQRMVAMAEAESVGKYLNENIKGAYEAMKVDV
jgi:hypothetical protein